MSEFDRDDDQSELTTIGFGQNQPIHVAIRNLIHDYPRDEGILKELIQNADDGGATEVRFILDLSDRNTLRGPIGAWSEFAEPAILAINNAPFSARDLERIQRLGDSGKVESPSETGKYGRGFNAVYNITDTPLLLTGDFVGFFDPCGWYGKDSNNGKGWVINGNFLKGYSDALKLFGAGTFDPIASRQSTSVFRFPLRSRLRGRSHHDRISDELFESTEFERLVAGLASLAEHLILFLRNIRFIGCYVCLDAQSELETLLEVTTINEGEVLAGRTQVNEILSAGSVGEVLQLIAGSQSGYVEAIYPHEIQVSRSGKLSNSKWMVSTGLYAGEDNRLIRQAQNLNEAHNRAVPAAGAAICVARDGEAFPATEGTVSCFLPLSKMLGGAHLPFHINGAFDLDGSRTGITRTQEGQSGSTRERAQWNQMLVADALAPASTRLIEACREPANSAIELYRVFPNSALEFPEPFKNFVKDVFEILSGLEVFGSVGFRWVRSSDLRLIPYDPVLQRCLATEMLPIPVPPLPDLITAALEKVNALPKPLSLVELRSHFCTTETGPWSIEDAPYNGLRSREAVCALSLYVSRFQPGIRWDGLPLALCQDGKLRRFGEGKSDIFFIADEKKRRVFSKFDEWFLDSEFVIQCRLSEAGAQSFRRMEPADFLKRLAFVTGESDSGSTPWNPEGQESPNRPWLLEVLEVINEFAESNTTEHPALRRAAIVPGHDGCLHRPGVAETPLLVQLAQQPLVEVLQLMSSPHWILNPQDPITRAITRFKETFALVWPLTPWDLVDTLHSKKSLLSGDDAAWRTDAVVSRLLGFLQAEIKSEEFGEKRLAKLRGLPLFKDAAGRFGPIDEVTYFAGAFAVPEVKVPFRLLQEDGHGTLLRALGVSEITRRRLFEECLLPRLEELEDQSLVGVMIWVRYEWNHLVHEFGGEPILISRLGEVACLIATTGERKAPFELYHPAAQQVVTNLLGRETHFPHTSWYEQDRQLWLRFFSQLGLATTPQPQDLVDCIEGITNRLTAGTTSVKREENTLTEILKHVLERWGSLAYQTVESNAHGDCSFYEFLADTEWIVPARIPNRFFEPYEVEDRLYAPEELLSATQAPRAGSVRCVFPRSIREFPTEVRERLRVDRIPSPSELCAQLRNVVARYGEQAIADEDLDELRRLVAGIYRGLGEHRQAAGESAVSAKINELVAICASFSDVPCIIICSEKRFRRPRDVYRSRHRQLFPLKSTTRSDEILVDNGLDLLGRRDEPSIEDLAEAIVDLGDQERALDQVELDAVVAALRLIRSKGEELGGPRTSIAVRVPNATGFLVEPGEVIFADDPGLAGQLPIDKHLLLLDGVPFETCIYSVARLSRAQAKPVGTLSDSEESSFVQSCRNLQETVQSQEFAEAICRILQHEGASYNLIHLRWLNCVRVSALVSVNCRFVIMLGSGREEDLGKATVDVAYDQSLGDGGTFLIAESAMEVLYNRFADELARELDNGPKDKAPLVAILSQSVGQIHRKLDRLGLARLRSDDFEEEGEDLEPEYESFPEDDLDGEVLPEGSNQNEPNPNEDPLTDNHEEEESDPPPDKDSKNELNPDKDDDAPDDEEEEEPEDEEEADEEEDGSGQSEMNEDEDSPNDSSGRQSDRRQLHGTQSGRTSSGGRIPGGPERDSVSSGPRGRMERGSRPAGANTSSHVNRPTRRAQDDLWISRPKTKQQVERSKQQNDKGDDEAPRNHSIGEAAVGWVLQFERQEGRRPQNMAHANPGYDIESRKGRVVERYIEVKGIDGEWGENGVPLSSLQFFKFQDRPELEEEGSSLIAERFWLYVVEHARDPEKVKIHMIQDPAGKVTEFRFDHGWKQAGETAEGFRPLSPAIGMKIRDLEDNEEGVITRVDENNYLMVQFGTGSAKTVIYRACDFELIDKNQ
jgi:sacsin